MYLRFFYDGVVYDVDLFCKLMGRCTEDVNRVLGIHFYFHSLLDCCVLEGSHDLDNGVFLRTNLGY